MTSSANRVKKPHELLEEINIDILNEQEINKETINNIYITQTIQLDLNCNILGLKSGLDFTQIFSNVILEKYNALASHPFFLKLKFYKDSTATEGYLKYLHITFLNCKFNLVELLNEKYGKNKKHIDIIMRILDDPSKEKSLVDKLTEIYNYVRKNILLYILREFKLYLEFQINLTFILLRPQLYGFKDSKFKSLALEYYTNIPKEHIEKEFYTILNKKEEANNKLFSSVKDKKNNGSSSADNLNFKKLNRKDLYHMVIAKVCIDNSYQILSKSAMDPKSAMDSKSAMDPKNAMALTNDMAPKSAMALTNDMALMNAMGPNYEASCIDDIEKLKKVSINSSIKSKNKSSKNIDISENCVYFINDIFKKSIGKLDELTKLDKFSELQLNKFNFKIYGFFGLKINENEPVLIKYNEKMKNDPYNEFNKSSVKSGGFKIKSNRKTIKSNRKTIKLIKLNRKSNKFS